MAPRRRGPLPRPRSNRAPRASDGLAVLGLRRGPDRSAHGRQPTTLTLPSSRGTGAVGRSWSRHEPHQACASSSSRGAEAILGLRLQVARVVPPTLDHHDSRVAEAADRMGKRTTRCKPCIGAHHSVRSASAARLGSAIASISTDAAVLRGNVKPTATPIAPSAIATRTTRLDRCRSRRRTRRVSIPPLFRLATRPLRKNSVRTPRPGVTPGHEDLSAC